MPHWYRPPFDLLRDLCARLSALSVDLSQLLLLHTYHGKTLGSAFPDATLNDDMIVPQSWIHSAKSDSQLYTPRHIL